MNLQVRVMIPAEIDLALDWASAEGWNPGLADAACFATVDPDGFLIGEIDGAPAATISTVNYNDGFAFLGFYVVRPDLRGRGLGLAIWRAAMAHAGRRVVGLDGVVAQQDNYRKSGFVLSHRNIRFGGMVMKPTVASDAMPLASVPFAQITASDATVFPAPRSDFLRIWISASGHHGRAIVRDGNLVAWGVIRPCRKGWKIGPLVADDPADAEIVFSALTADAGGGEIFLDVPEPNRQAVAFAEAMGLAPVFETARMYTGPVRPMRLDRVFGVTSFELG